MAGRGWAKTIAPKRCTVRAWAPCPLETKGSWHGDANQRVSTLRIPQHRSVPNDFNVLRTVRARGFAVRRRETPIASIQRRRAAPSLERPLFLRTVRDNPPISLPAACPRSICGVDSDAEPRPA
jgi:hypothetical protein